MLYRKRLLGVLVGILLLGGVSSTFAGRVKFNVCLSFGESATLATSGPLAFRADCNCGSQFSEAIRGPVDRRVATHQILQQLGVRYPARQFREGE